MLITFVSLGILGIVATYAYVYVYELSSEQMIWTAVAKLPGVFVALPLMYWLSKWLDKKQIVIWIILLTSTLIASPHILKMLGLFVANDSPYLLYALFGPLLLGFMIFPVSQIIIDSQLVDVADEHEYQTGSRAEGVIFSIRSFGNKATQGVGGFIAGFGLEYIGFPENAEVGSLAPETITGLLFLNGPVYLAIYLLAVFCMTFYNIDEKRHNELLVELEARREAASGAGE
jgi:Na+/melibiose symporter-like transporter